MAVAVRSSTTLPANGTATTATVTKPTGAAVGDVLVAVVCADPSMPSVPTGWTQAGTGASNVPVYVWWKTVAADEPATYSFATTGASGYDIVIDVFALTGANTSAPISQIVFGGSGADVTPHIAPTVTPGAAGAMLFTAYGTRGGTQTHTPPTGMTELYDNGDGYAYLSVNNLALTTTAATGTKTSTPGSADAYTSVSFIVAPAAAGGDTTAPTVPGSFTATAAGQTTVNLAWTASTDAVGVTGYTITRNGTTVTTTATGTSYSDTGRTAGTLYTYTISAHDAAGNASATATATATTASSIPALPNQVSATLLRTTAGGTPIYKYEVQTSTAGGLTAGQKQAYLYVPATKSGAASTKLVFAAHGLGGLSGDMMEEAGATLPLLDLLADAGYVTVAVEYEATYGNTDSQARLARAYAYATGVWADAGTVLFGFSMGGAISAAAMHKHTIPARAVQLIAPPLQWTVFAPESQGAIYTAYGVSVGDNAAFATATAAWDPARQPVSQYAGQRWRVNTSPTDDYQTLRPSAVSFLNSIASVAAQAIDVQVTGGHGAATEYANPAQMVAFYDAAIAAPVPLTVNGARSATRAGKALLAQATTLTVSGARAATRVGSPQLAQAHPALTVASTRTSTRASSPVLAQATALTVRGARSSSRAGAVLVTQDSTLTIRGARAATRAGTATLSQATVLSVGSARAGTRAATATLAQTTTLAVTSARASARAGNALLTQVTALQVTGARSATRASQPLLVAAGSLLIDGTRSSTRAQSVLLAQTTPLTVAAARAGTRAHSVLLSQATALLVAGARAATRAGTALLTSTGSALQVSSARAQTRATAALLQQAQLLTVAAARAPSRATRPLLADYAPSTAIAGPEHTLLVPADDRTLVIAADDRTLTVTPDLRTLTVPA